MLDRATSSVRNQTYPSEILIVEDEEQKGPAWARNRGLEKASTKYVAMLDADDYWEEDKLERQLEVVENSNKGLCVESKNKQMTRDDYTRDDFITDIIKDNIFPLTSSILIDRRELDINFDETLIRYQDALFLVEAAIKVGVCAIPDLFHAHIHEKGHSATTTIEDKLKYKNEYYNNVCEVAPEFTDLVEDQQSQLHYAVGVQARKNGDIRFALNCLIKSIKYGLNDKNFRALVSLPIYYIKFLIEP